MSIKPTAATSFGAAFTAALAFASLADQPLRTAALDKDDMKFFEKAASANKLEIESGNLAARNATTPELKEFGRKMASDHARADSDLRALAARKGVTLPAAMSAADQKKIEKLREEKPGKDFDNEFRDLMVDGHQAAVSLFEGTSKDAKDPDVKEFAAKMLPTLHLHESGAKALPKS